MNAQRKGGKPASDPRAVSAWRAHRPKLRGETKRLAEHLKVSTPAVSKWRQVPEARYKEAADFLGVRPADLRPDLHPAPWDALLPTQTRGAR